MMSRLAKIASTFRRQRRRLNTLESLSDHQLADLGLMRSDIDGFVRRSISLG